MGSPAKAIDNPHRRDPDGDQTVEKRILGKDGIDIRDHDGCNRTDRKGTGEQDMKWKSIVQSEREYCYQ